MNFTSIDELSEDKITEMYEHISDSDELISDYYCECYIILNCDNGYTWSYYNYNSAGVINGHCPQTPLSSHWDAINMCGPNRANAEYGSGWHTWQYCARHFV